jgi:hypothetical protein
MMIPDRIARTANAVTTLLSALFEQQRHPVRFTNRFIFGAINIL